MPFIILGIVAVAATIKATHITLKFAYNLSQPDGHMAHPRPRSRHHQPS